MYFIKMLIYSEGQLLNHEGGYNHIMHQWLFFIIVFYVHIFNIFLNLKRIYIFLLGFKVFLRFTICLSFLNTHTTCTSKYESITHVYFE